MPRSGFPCLVAATTLMGAALASAVYAKDESTAAGLHNHDGLYAVNVTTKHGDCDNYTPLLILISGGRFSSFGNTPMHASGHISPQGHVDLTLNRFHHVAKATGTLNGNAGSGTWHSSSLSCTGTWHARRRT